MKGLALLLAIFVAAGALLRAPHAAAEPPITAAAFTPDGKQVVVGTQAKLAVYAWPSLARKREMLAGYSLVHDVAFSRDGKSLAIAGGEPGHYGGFRQFDWPSGRPHASHDMLPDVAYQLAWTTHDQHLALAGGHGHLLLADLDGKIVRRMTGHSRDVFAVAASDDGKLLLSASGDQSVRIWNAESGELARTLSNHTGEVRDLALRPQREGLPLVASAGGDNTIRFWQPTIGRMLRFVRLPSAPLAIDWTPDGKKLLVACEDGRLRVVDPEAAKVVQDSAAIDGWAYVVLASPDAQHALVAGEREQIRAISLD